MESLENRIQQLEELLTHQSILIEELSLMLNLQYKKLEKLQKQYDYLGDRFLKLD